MNTRNRTTASFALALLALLLGAAPALAAPSFGVQLTRPEANEVQQVFVDATAGAFGLTFKDSADVEATTGDIAATAAAVEVENALNALPNLSAGDGAVSVTGGGTSPGGREPYL